MFVNTFQYLDLYGEYLKQNLKIASEYRFNFFLGVFSTASLQVGALVAVYVVLSQVGNLHGWTFYELLLVNGLFMSSQGINNTFFNSFFHLSNSYIRTGDFDRYLVRPIHPLFHLIADKFNFSAIGDVLLGVFAVTFAVVKLDVPISAFQILQIGTFIVCGGLILASLSLVAASFAFKIIDATPIVWAVGFTAAFVKYPLSIFPTTLRVLFTWVVPIGFVSVIPADMILKGAGSLSILVVASITVVLATIGYTFWRIGLRNYSSTGS